MTKLTTTAIPINHIERKPNSQKYRIIGKGVTVEFLSYFINNRELPVERICENYGLTPAEVHAAWSFYYDHQGEIDARLAAECRRDVYTPEELARRERVLKRYEEIYGHPFQPYQPETTDHTDSE